MIVQPMEFSRPVARSYRLSRRNPSGNTETTTVRVSEPYEGDGIWHADVEILPIRQRPFVMCGVDAKQALDLSDSFVASLAGAKGWVRDDS